MSEKDQRDGAGSSADPGNQGESSRAGDITRLLRLVRQGDPNAADRLLPLVYDQLRYVARAVMRRERRDHTLQPTALVHEAWIRLTEEAQPDYRDRTHFLFIAAKVMRRILVEYARARRAAKRGGRRQRVALEDLKSPPEAPSRVDVDMLALHEALIALEALNTRQAKVIELRYFGGLTIRETADALGLGTTTVEDDWEFARAWLRRRLEIA